MVAQPKALGTATDGGGQSKGPRTVKTQARRSSAPSDEAREVIYPNLTAVVFAPGHERGPITAEMAQKWLGWETEQQFEVRVLKEYPNASEEKRRYGENFLLKDMNGVKIRCNQNSGNRPFTESWARQLCQDILRRQYVLNGEAIIIGKTGRILSGQHRLCALVMAKQMWESDSEGAHWKVVWETEPVLESFVSFGVDESARTVRTLDNVRARTLTDTLFTDEQLSNITNPADRKVIARMMEWAVRFLWERTGAKKDPFAPLISHGEAHDFMTNHPHLLRACKEIYRLFGNMSTADGKLDLKKKLDKTWWSFCTQQIGAGYAAALLFLMGCSNSDGDSYRDSGPDGTKPLMEGSGKKGLNWDCWDKAVEFWTAFCSSEAFGAKVREARRPVEGDEDEYSGYIFGTGNGSGKLAERIAVLVQAWNAYKEGATVDESIELITPEVIGEPGIQYSKLCANIKEVETGAEPARYYYTLASRPNVGGIDLGPMRAEPKAKKETDTGDKVPEEAEGEAAEGEESEEGSEENSPDADTEGAGDGEGTTDDPAETPAGEEEEDLSKLKGQALKDAIQRKRVRDAQTRKV